MRRRIAKLVVLVLSCILGRVRVARLLGVKVGQHCRLLTLNFGQEPWLISIGNKVTITAGVIFLTHDGSTWLIEDDRGRRYHYGRIEIGNEVFIGVHSILMPGVRIGNQCIIGAGSVVTRSVPSGSVVAGSPARVIGSYLEYRDRILRECPSQQDMGGSSYRERTERLAFAGFRPELAAIPSSEREKKVSL